MLIRSNRLFQDGGNGETIVLEESRPLKASGRGNEGWKQAVGYPPLICPSDSLLFYFLFTVSRSLSPPL